jgi:hypothetical protein
MFKKTFTEAYRAGEASIESVHDYIEYWHTHDTGNDLYQFLGMSKSQFAEWMNRSDDVLGVILDEEGEFEPLEIPTCKICGARMAVETAVGLIAKSNYIGEDICYDCIIDHCCSTDCAKCTIAKDHTNCEHLDRKIYYMTPEED